MIDLQAWPPLCGAVAGCGALLALSGSAKLARTARGAGEGTAVQKALRLNGTAWRGFQGLAGSVELAVGALVCTATLPMAADALMACQGVAFVVLLTYVMRKRIPGDCGCVTRRRPSSPDRHAVTRSTVARAVLIALAGLAGATVGVRPPFALPRVDELSAGAVALATVALLVVIDVELLTPRCRRSLLFPVRTRLIEVTKHDLYQAMAASLGADGEHVLFRRAGCVDEFWFPAGASGTDDPRFLEVKASRTGTGALALRATVAEHPPPASSRRLALRRDPAEIRGRRPSHPPVRVEVE